ncbi:MAG: DUF1778 domain-containing protein [Pseudomonadota bacterium]|nr:DUF1778 domain-containing protein [Pseudomonadota bacterium]
MDESTTELNAASRTRREGIAGTRRTMLAPEDHAVVFAALDLPPEPTPELREAFLRHKASVTEG